MPSARLPLARWSSDRQAFLEFFADDAVGFEGGAERGQNQIPEEPDPPPDLQLIWEPRYGDVAASSGSVT